MLTLGFGGRKVFYGILADQKIKHFIRHRVIKTPKGEVGELTVTRLSNPLVNEQISTKGFFRSLYITSPRMQYDYETMSCSRYVAGEGERGSVLYNKFLPPANGREPKQGTLPKQG